MRDDLTPMLHTLREAQELSRSMSPLVESYRRLGAFSGLEVILRDYERIAPGMRWSSLDGAGLPGPASLFSDTQGMSVTLRNVIDQLQLAAGGVGALSRVADLAMDVGRLATPFEQVSRALAAQSTAWQDTLQLVARSSAWPVVAGPTLGSALLSWSYGVEQALQRFRQAGMLEQGHPLVLRVLDSTEAFTAFAETTTRRLSRAGTRERAVILGGSLRLAQDELLTGLAALSPMVSVPEDAPPALVPRALRLPAVQQAELLAADDRVAVAAAAEAGPASLVEWSPAAAAAQRAYAVLRLITACNEAAQISGREAVFKPTTRLLEAFIDLPQSVATSKPRLAEVVDALFFVFYEGAGKDHLRFLRAEGGVLELADCTFIWCVKALRNKWLRHDPDHGQASAVRATWRSVGEQLRWLGVEYYPQTAAHYRLLQARLLEEAETFLACLLERLQTVGPAGG
jgi:hypothetical protein